MSRRPTDLEVGYIAKAHGLRGELNVRLTGDRAERMVPGAQLRTDTSVLVVQRSRPHHKGHLVFFEGVDTREAADALRGTVLYGEPIDDPGTIWVHDLIGASIEEVDGTPRGSVVAVQENPASDLLVTETGALIPLTFYVQRRDDGVLVIDPPLGLFGDED
ncbi:MAG: ribosome maturation factor RimM [Acidimicrobiales bacterium]